MEEKCTEDQVNLLRIFATQAAIAIENARLYEQAYELSATDPLTGLYNRRYFFQIYASEIERLRRYDGQLALILVDFDHFKQINDTYGHLTGDKVLVYISKLMRESLRRVDLIARFGGEEFVVMMPSTSLDEARQVAQRICETIACGPIHINGYSIQVSASLGVAAWESSYVESDTLLRHVDQAMYQAKAEGRNRVSIWRQIR